jgi:hypothetical protein
MRTQDPAWLPASEHGEKLRYSRAYRDMDFYYITSLNCIMVSNKILKIYYAYFTH